MKQLRRFSAALLVLGACTPARPPYSLPPGALDTADDQKATVVFLWPETSCDPPGYLTLVTGGGAFVGNITRGSRLTAHLPPGDSTVVGWNGVVESAMGTLNDATIPVLRAHLEKGRTYDVRVLFGTWDEAPAAPLRGYRYARCVHAAGSSVSTLLALSPTREEWSDVAAWSRELTPLVPDQAAGQAWLDANRPALGAHLAAAEGRYASSSTGVQRLITLEPGDAAPR